MNRKQEKNLPAIVFTAEDYRREYLQLKRVMPSKAEKILKAITTAYKEEYKKAKKPLGVKLVNGVAGLGFLGGLGAAVSGIGLGVAGILSAPVAVPLVIGGGVVFSTMMATAHKIDLYARSADSRLERDLEEGDLLKRYVEGLKSYDRTLPAGFETLTDESMAKRFESKSVQAALPASLPFAFLGGAFNDNAPAAPETPASAPGQEKKPEGPKR